MTPNWKVLSRTKDNDGETTTWLVDFGKPQEQATARDDTPAEGAGDQATTEQRQP